jgi:hypothetical protein
MEKENFPRRGRGIEMGSILDGGEWSGKVLPPNVVKHVNRIRIGRGVIVRKSDNRNTNRKILPK